MPRFWATDGHRKCAVFLFYLSSHYHIYVFKSLYALETITLKIWQRPMSWPAKVFTSGCRPWLKNLACLSSLLSWTTICRMRAFRLQNSSRCNYNELNHRSLSCSQVISITISAWKLKYGRIWQKLRCLLQEPNGMLVRRWQFWREKSDKTPSTATVFTKWAYNVQFVI